MDKELLLKAADLIEEDGCWSNVSYYHDMAAYILRAAGKDPLDMPGNGPYFDTAIKMAQLPNDKVLWSGGWPDAWKEEIDNFFPDRELMATLAAGVLRDYVEKDGWRA